MRDAEAPSTTQRTFRWTVFIAATAIVVYLCLLVLWPFLNVLAWSVVLAIAFYPVHQWLIRKTGRPSLSAFVCSVLVVGVILIPLLFITGVAINQFLALRAYLQETFENGFDLTAIEPLAPGLRVGHCAPGDRPGAGGRLARGTRGRGWERRSRRYSLTIAANVTGVVISFIFTMFAVFLLLRDGGRMVARIPDLLPFEPARSEAMLLRIRDVIYASVYGVVVIAVIQGALIGIMFRALGIPAAALWGTVTVVTSVLPLVGAGAVWVPGALYLLVIGHWPQAIVLAVFGGVVISSVDNFLRPRLVGGRVGLNELVMFFALLGGIQAFGLLGIILGPVLFAVASSLFEVLGSARPASDER